MTHQKPEPIVLSGGDIVFARAYPYRPPTARQPHWSWRMTTVKSGQGRVQKYLARLRPEDVPSALAAAYAEVATPEVSRRARPTSEPLNTSSVPGSPGTWNLAAPRAERSALSPAC